MKTTTVTKTQPSLSCFRAKSDFLLLLFKLCVLSSVWATLLAPLGVYHRVFQTVCVKLEPALQWLDFSVRGYMMSKPIDNQCKSHGTSPCPVLSQASTAARLWVGSAHVYVCVCVVCSSAEAHRWCSFWWRQWQWGGAGCFLSSSKSVFRLSFIHKLIWSLLLS